MHFVKQDTRYDAFLFRKTPHVRKTKSQKTVRIRSQSIISTKFDAPSSEMRPEPLETAGNLFLYICLQSKTKTAE